MTDTQPASPVISPGVSTAIGVFSQVRTTTDNRLNHTASGFNRLPNIIASGRATKPQADSSNALVATVDHYQPKPGRQMARSMNLDIQNTPPPQVDAIIDAIQRYLEIKPRREPTADPKAEASIARHPQQIIESSQRWADASRYQFASNGVESYQIRPEYHAWTGSLNLALHNEGSTDIYAPPTRSPLTGAPGYGATSTLGQYPVYDPAYAAQETMSRMLAVQAPEQRFLTSGAPLMSEDPYFDPAYAAQNAAAKLNALLNSTEAEPVTVGAANIIDSGYSQPRQAWYASTQVAYGLAQQRGLNLAPASSFHSMAENDAYLRSMNIINGSTTPVVAGKV